MTRRSHSHGFTLLELLLAISIFAIVSALAYGGLNAVLRASQHTQLANSNLQSLQVALSIIQQDLSQITGRSVQDENGESQPPVIGPDRENRPIAFTRRGWKNPAQRQRSTLQRIIYQVDEDENLIRSYWRKLDLAPNSEALQLPLLEGVSELVIRFMDTQNEWKESWPPLSTEPDQPVALPKAVEITLKTQQWGDIIRIVPVQGGLGIQATKFISDAGNQNDDDNEGNEGDDNEGNGEDENNDAPEDGQNNNGNTDPNQPSPDGEGTAPGQSGDNAGQDADPTAIGDPVSE